jgi:hypothetical protein
MKARRGAFRIVPEGVDMLLRNARGAINASVEIRHRVTEAVDHARWTQAEFGRRDQNWGAATEKRRYRGRYPG